MTSQCSFNTKHYRSILRNFIKNKYHFCYFTEKVDNTVKQIYLRHDVDYSPLLALKLAKIESEEKVISSYFFRLKAPFYNVFDEQNLEIILKIVRMGHQVGLHFESTNKKVRSTNDLIKEIKKQFTILEESIDINRIVSFHRPKYISNNILNKKIKGYISTYEPQFFQDVKYLSDSRGVWKELCVCQWLKTNKDQSYQILTHPIWWFKRNLDSNKHLHNFILDIIEQYKNSMKADSDIFINK